MILQPNFYQRTDVVQIAKDLLGMVLVTRFDGVLTAGRITETEAYRAPDDRACHAWNNRRTARTETMFLEGGCSYIYLCYGMHHLFNVVTGPENMAHAVLIRAIEPLDGIETMLQRRKMDKIKPNLSAGPGTLSQALGLSTLYDNTLLTSPDSLIWIEDRGLQVPAANIKATPRIGVAYAGECALWEWRFS
jgi:DNA-3-methyladenine glycosylase